MRSIQGQLEVNGGHVKVSWMLMGSGQAELEVNKVN